jgi:hypothetical protein
MNTYTFIWKLIDGDKFEMAFTGYDNFQEAVDAWHMVWGITFDQCEEFNVIETNEG